MRRPRSAGSGGACAGATVTLDPPQLALPESFDLDAETLNKALAELGDYRAKPLTQE